VGAARRFSRRSAALVALSTSLLFCSRNPRRAAPVPSHTARAALSAPPLCSAAALLVTRLSRADPALVLGGRRAAALVAAPLLLLLCPLRCSCRSRNPRRAALPAPSCAARAEPRPRRAAPAPSRARAELRLPRLGAALPAPPRSPRRRSCHRTRFPR